MTLNFKRLGIFAVTALAIIGAAFFLTEKRFCAGLAAGFITGALNIAAIIYTVRNTYTPEAKKGAAPVTVLIYVAKLMVIGVIIALVIVFRKYYSIIGFLIGFSLTLLLLVAEYVLSVLLNKQEKK